MLSYEGVFLYLLALDAGWVARPEDSAPTCCRLSKSGARANAQDAPIVRFCAALGLLLLEVKLQDDVRDNGSLLARGGLWWWRRPLRRARQVLLAADAGLLRELDEVLERHDRLESDPKSWNRGGDVLEQFCQPTADAFALVFARWRMSRGASRRSLGCRRLDVALEQQS